MKIKEINFVKIFYYILIPVTLIYLYGELNLATGRLKERQSRQCLTAAQVENWKSVISLAENVYLNVSQDYQTNLDALEGSVKYWRGSSLWYSDQLDSCQEGNAFLQEELFED